MQGRRASQRPAVVAHRLKSGIYVSALIRRCASAGVQAYLVRRGAEEAGAIFIKVNRLDGTCYVLSPAQRAMLGDDDGRAWTRPIGESAGDAKAAEYFARQLKFDPDIWIVEIEDREGRAFVEEPIV
jgi:hypothetical protein